MNAKYRRAAVAAQRCRLAGVHLAVGAPVKTNPPPVSTTPAAPAIELLVRVGVLGETTGRKRGRSFVNQGYLGRPRVGT
jgi:hypothetical protein